MTPSLATSEYILTAWPDIESVSGTLRKELVRLLEAVVNLWGGGPEISVDPARASLVPTAQQLASQRVDVATSTDPQSPAHHQLALALVISELRIVQRLLDVMTEPLLQGKASHASPAAQTYLTQIGQLFQTADQRRLPIDDAVNILGAGLCAARDRLLREVPTVRQWVRFTRAIDPNAPLRVPQRFIRKSVTHDTQIDKDALKAAVWVRSLDI